MRPNDTTQAKKSGHSTFLRRPRSCLRRAANDDRCVWEPSVRGGGNRMFNVECGIIRTSSEQRLRTVYLVRGSVLSLSFVKPNKPDGPNKPDRPDRPNPRHALRKVGLHDMTPFLHHVRRRMLTSRTDGRPFASLRGSSPRRWCA